MSNQKTVADYKALPYTRKVDLIREDSGEEYFVARIVELTGVEADGSTPFEARYRLEQAFEDYLEAMLEWGEEIPQPDNWPQDYDTERVWTPAADSGVSAEDQPVGEMMDVSKLDPTRELVPSGTI